VSRAVYVGRGASVRLVAGPVGERRPRVYVDIPGVSGISGACALPVTHGIVHCRMVDEPEGSESWRILRYLPADEEAPHRERRRLPDIRGRPSRRQPHDRLCAHGDRMTRPPKKRRLPPPDDPVVSAEVIATDGRTPRERLLAGGLLGASIRLNAESVAERLQCELGEARRWMQEWRRVGRNALVWEVDGQLVTSTYVLRRFGDGLPVPTEARRRAPAYRPPPPDGHAQRKTVEALDRILGPAHPWDTRELPEVRPLHPDLSPSDIIPSSRERGSWIYAIGTVGQPFVKIGVSRDVRARLCGLQTANPNELRVIAAIREELGWTEWGMHQRFQRYRARGEWFRLEGDLRDWLQHRLYIVEPWLLENA